MFSVLKGSDTSLKDSPSIEVNKNWPEKISGEAADQVQHRRGPEHDAAEPAGRLASSRIIRVTCSSSSLKPWSNRVDVDEVARNQDSGHSKHYVLVM